MNVFFGNGEYRVLVHKPAALHAAKLQDPLFSRSNNENLPNGMLYLLAQGINDMGQGCQILFDGGNHNVYPG
ncbi:hypothetical protein D3C75_940630 [compost metagenome]